MEFWLLLTLYLCTLYLCIVTYMYYAAHNKITVTGWFHLLHLLSISARPKLGILQQNENKKKSLALLAAWGRYRTWCPVAILQAQASWKELYNFNKEAKPHLALGLQARTSINTHCCTTVAMAVHAHTVAMAVHAHTSYVSSCWHTEWQYLHTYNFASTLPYRAMLSRLHAHYSLTPDTVAGRS